MSSCALFEVTYSHSKEPTGKPLCVSPNDPEGKKELTLGSAEVLACFGGALATGPAVQQQNALLLCVFGIG